MKVGLGVIVLLAGYSFVGLAAVSIVVNIITLVILLFLAVRRQDPGAYIHLIISGLTTESYWEQALHRNSDQVIRLALRHIEGMAITNIAFHLGHEPEPSL